MLFLSRQVTHNFDGAFSNLVRRKRILWEQESLIQFFATVPVQGVLVVMPTSHGVIRVIRNIEPRGVRLERVKRI